MIIKKKDPMTPIIIHAAKTQNTYLLLLLSSDVNNTMTSETENKTKDILRLV